MELAGAAALPAAGLAGIPAAAPDKADPIFAAIERHRVAWEALDRGGDALAEVFTPEAHAEIIRLNDQLDSASEAMIETNPATLLGAIALLRYAAEIPECLTQPFG